jgi:putative DNA primase/helicase
MDYIEKIKAAGFSENPQYPQNDIGIARLFYELHSGAVRYVVEAKTWFAYDGRRWVKSNGVFRAMELCKNFVQGFNEYAAIHHTDDEKLGKYAEKLTSRRNREGILSDARSIAPVSLSDFDRNRILLNCQSGTLNLKTFELQPHNAADLITKIAAVKYDTKARCARWDRFIGKVMCGDTDTAVYLQNALGYALTGLTEYECFFILYGNTSRNGKTTLTETVAHILADYAVTTQPQTFSRRSSNGAAPSPDTARLKGARLVNMPEPDKGMELNTALIKQLTGGDTYTGRFLNENSFEFAMEGKIVINTNHLPQVSDDTIFASGRAKVIPFERHFTEAEQDKGLKHFFRRGENKSAILNWLVTGYRLILEAGFDPPQRVANAIAAYRAESDIIGVFLAEYTVEKEKGRLSTSELHKHYAVWAKGNGYVPLNNRPFVGELKRRRFVIKPDCKKGNVILGMALAFDTALPA